MIGPGGFMQAPKAKDEKDLRPIMKGEIAERHEVFVFCGLCPTEQRLHQGVGRYTKTQAKVDARRIGWHLTRDYGWICPGDHTEAFD
jgi:hypothetical protein